MHNSPLSNKRIVTEATGDKADPRKYFAGDGFDGDAGETNHRAAMNCATDHDGVGAFGGGGGGNGLKDLMGVGLQGAAEDGEGGEAVDAAHAVGDGNEGVVGGEAEGIEEREAAADEDFGAAGIFGEGPAFAAGGAAGGRPIEKNEAGGVVGEIEALRLPVGGGGEGLRDIGRRNQEAPCPDSGVEAMERRALGAATKDFGGRLGAEKAGGFSGNLDRKVDGVARKEAAAVIAEVRPCAWPARAWDEDFEGAVGLGAGDGAEAGDRLDD